MLKYFSPAFRLFWRDNIVRWTAGVAAITVLIDAIIILAIFPHQSNLPLHYNIPFGVDYIGSWYEVWWLPVLVLIFTITNCVVGFWIWRRDRVLSYFMLAGTVYVAVIILTALALITWLNRTYVQ
jgi:hypothetical protein